MLARLSTLAVLSATLIAQAQTPAPVEPPLKAELEAMLESDQRPRAELPALAARHGADSSEVKALASRTMAQDRANQKRLAEILDREGWPAKARLGAIASEAAFVVLQHAPLALQQRYLPMLRAAVQAGDAEPRWLGPMEDRVRTGEGRPQLYGTQLGRHPDGRPMLLPIEAPDQIDARRAALGMEPIAVVAQRHGIPWGEPGSIGPMKISQARCPDMPAPQLPIRLPNGDFKAVIHFLLKADGRIENVRLEGRIPKSLGDAIVHAVNAYQCKPAEADVEVVSDFRVKID